MKNIIVITGHGKYASGFLSCIETIYGKHECLHAIDFNDDDIGKIYDSFIKKNSNNNIIFICDMVGGTPFKECSKRASSLNVRVLTGINIGALIQVVFNINNYELDMLANDLISFTNRNVIMYNNIKKEENDSSSGI